MITPFTERGAMTTPTQTDRPKNRGRFKPGHDPRRHRFTTEECQRGFWNAIYSIVERYPDAIGDDGRHMAFNFLAVAGRLNKEKAQ
jgi:hypothetical protein